MRYGASHREVIIIFVLITLFTLIKQWLTGAWNSMIAMQDFMGAYFLIFGMFKLVDLRGFVNAYTKYNLIAKHIISYAYALPFIELGIAAGYLFHTHLLLVNGINFIVMLLGFISVTIVLIKKEIIPCACLGTLFHHKLSLISLGEHALMVIMSLSMVLYHYYTHYS